MKTKKANSKSILNKLKFTHFVYTALIILLFYATFNFVMHKVEISELNSVNDFTIYNDDHFLIKNPKSKYTIVEYLDLDCKHCRAQNEKLRKETELLSNFNYIVRMKPTIDKRGRSLDTFRLSECVYETTRSDKYYFAFLDKYYTETKSSLISMDKVMLLAENVIREEYPDAVANLHECYISPRMIKKVDDRNIDAVLLGVTAVPTLMILDESKAIKSTVVGEKPRFIINLLRELLVR